MPLFIFRKKNLYGISKKSTHGHQTKKPFRSIVFLATRQLPWRKSATQEPFPPTNPTSPSPTLNSQHTLETHSCKSISQDLADAILFHHVKLPTLHRSLVRQNIHWQPLATYAFPSCLIPYILGQKPRYIGEIEAKDGLPSADRNNKATLLLTGPFRTAKSSAKDLTPLVLKLQYAKYRSTLLVPRKNRLLRR